MAEQVDAEGAADGEELLCVDRGLVEEFLERARCDADAVGEPLVGVARAAQLVADKFANVNLHNCCYLFFRKRGACVPHAATESVCSDDHRQKKEGEQSRLQSAVVGITF